MTGLSYAQHRELVDSLLKRLRSSGHLVPGAVLPDPPARNAIGASGAAMILRAAEDGAAGRALQVVFANVTVDETDPAKTRFDATVICTEKYAALSDDPNSDKFLKKVLGTDKVPGAEPLLVHPLEDEEPTRPRAGQYPLAGGADGKKSQVAIPGAEGDAFTLEAGLAGKDGDSITVTVSEVKGRTFTLAAVWEKTAAGLTAADLPEKLPGSGSLLTATAPDGGFAAPLAGAFPLTDGSGAKAAPVAVPG